MDDLTKTLNEAFLAVEENDSKRLSSILRESPKILNKYGEKGRGRGSTLLIYSILTRNYDCSKTLIQFGANVNKKSKVGRKQSCLMLLIGYWVDLDLLEMILAAGAKVMSPNRFSDFPLGEAVKFAYANGIGKELAPEVVKKILKYGADPDYAPRGQRSARKYLEDMSRVSGIVPSWLTDLIPIDKST